MTKIGGNASYRPPGASYILQNLQPPEENQNLETKISIKKMIPWETFVIPLNLPQNLTQGRSRHAGAESEVKSCQILHPKPKIRKN